MPPLPLSATPRIVVYYQTHHTPSGAPISILPLLTTSFTSITHLIVAAIHLNQPPGNITLNDHSPNHPRNQSLWAELAVLRASGVKVLGMLGGAAQGSFAALDGPAALFEANYTPLRDFVRARALDGLDLDVEEPMALENIVRLIDRLKTDFGPNFIVTLAPVAAALLNPTKNLSGFDYEALEVLRGSQIGWYNTQFYCGWGDARTTLMYDAIVRKGFPAGKVVVGLVTNPDNGTGWVSFAILQQVLMRLREAYGPGFGGVMGWEYFNSLPGGQAKPWEWAHFMTTTLRGVPQALAESGVSGVQNLQENISEENEEAGERVVDLADADEDSREEASLPGPFEYFTDESAEE